jgi:SAM-dependent methyltransferase
MPPTSTEPTPRGIWSQFVAAIYDPFLALGERRGMRERRLRLLRRARGQVLEIGAGTGLNLAHYPGELDELLLSEPVDAMARRLESRLRRSGAGATVLRAGAEALPVATGSIDTVVSTMVLCTVPDPEAALLRSGGCCVRTAGSCSASTCAPTRTAFRAGRSVLPARGRHSPMAVAAIRRRSG